MSDFFYLGLRLRRLCRDRADNTTIIILEKKVAQERHRQPQYQQPPVNALNLLIIFCFFE